MYRQKLEIYHNSCGKFLRIERFDFTKTKYENRFDVHKFQLVKLYPSCGKRRKPKKKNNILIYAFQSRTTQEACDTDKLIYADTYTYIRIHTETFLYRKPIYIRRAHSTCVFHVSAVA